MRGESMKDKSKKSTYSTTFGIDPFMLASILIPRLLVAQKKDALKQTPMVDQ